MPMRSHGEGSEHDPERSLIGVAESPKRGVLVWIHMRTPMTLDTSAVRRIRLATQARPSRSAARSGDNEGDAVPLAISDIRAAISASRPCATC